MNIVDKKRAERIWLSLGATAVLGIALGCGEIGGAGQCNGVDVTGMCVTVDSIQPTDTVTGFGDTSDVDAFITLDCDPTTPVFEVEPFGKHAAKVTFSGNLMSGVTSPPAPAFVTWNGYTIEYVASPTNLVSAPPLSSQVFGGDNLKVNADSSVTWTLEFVSSQTKEEYVNNGGSVWPPAVYTAIYTFTGTSQFNQEVVLKASVGFNIGDYDLCSK